MTKRTAAKVADLLGLVEAYLKSGRPRKAPGKPRPPAVSIWGQEMKKVSNTDFFIMDKVSLPTAFKVATREQGYSRNVKEWAGCAFIGASGNSHLLRDERGLVEILQQIDDEAWDTQELRRDLRRARKWVEKVYLAA